MLAPIAHGVNAPEDAMDFHLFMYCRVGRRHELEAGMAGRAFLDKRLARFRGR